MDLISTGKVKKILFWVLACCGISFSGYGQTYPVSASTQLIPPYSTYLADYVSPGSNKLALNLFLGDLDRIDLQTRLKLRIEGQGIVIETKPEYLPAPLILQGGVAERLTAADLEPYFRPENLNFQGLTRQQFQRTGQLPEGLYRFCFEVLEYNRGVQISNTACATAWLILNDPPIVNLPRNGEKLRAQDPQYVVFQWTPRHTGSPNSAFTTEYEFSLVELWPENRNPNDAILTTPPIFETTTQSTTVIYGPAETPLIPGRHYAFRVRAKSISGIDELDLFKNQGYSQTHKFIYGDACLLPTDIRVKIKGTTRFQLGWQPNFNHTDFTVRYREAGNNPSPWYEDDTFFEELEIGSLKPATVYEYQVVASCGPFTTEYSPIAEVTTNEMIESDFVCGTDAMDFDLDNHELINSLKPGDYIYAGDFDIRLDSVTGSNGVFSGGGKAQLPFLNYVKVRTVFENVTINTDHRVIQGNVYTYWDANSRLLFDVPSTKPDSEPSDNGGDSEPIVQADPTDEIGNIPTDTISVDDLGNVTVVTDSGDTLIIEPDGGVIVADTEGDSSSDLPSVEGDAGVGTGNGDTAGSTTGNGSSDPTTGTSIANADATFGPLQIRFDTEPTSNQTDEEGFCLFENVKASFILSLEGQYEISKQVTIEGATISFKKHCERDEYKELTLNWSDPSGIDLGQIKFVKAKVRTIELSVDDEGNLGGTVAMNVSQEEDYTLNNLVKIKKGVNGDFDFTFNNSNSFEGSFNFSGISGINLDLIKSGKKLAGLEGGSLDENGALSGRLVAKNIVDYQSNGLTVMVNQLEVDVELSMQSGFTLVAGEGELTVKDISGIDGSLIADVSFEEASLITQIKANRLSGYGFEIKNSKVRAIIDSEFEIERIEGSFDVKHSDFSTEIEISRFEVEDGSLITFNGNGRINYDDLSINITEMAYDAEKDRMVINGNVEVVQDGIKIAATIYDFSIDRQGNIEFGGYDAHIEGQLVFGPLALALKSEVEKTENVDGPWKRYATDASLYLKIKDTKGYEKEVAIAEAQVEFIKHKRENKYKNITVSIDKADIPIGQLHMIEAAITKFNLSLETESEYLTGLPDDASQVDISGSSSITLKAELKEDKKFNELITLKKGVEGEFTFNFEKGKEFKGSFNFEGIRNLNVQLKKGNKILASLERGALDQQGTLKGTIKSKSGVDYASGTFKVGVEKLDLDVEMNMVEGIESFKILEGSGVLFLEEIKGVEGQLKFGVQYEHDESVTAHVLSDQTSLKAFGMDLDDLNLITELTNELDIVKVEGSLKAKHPELGTKLEVSEFKIEAGELKALKANGLVDYKGFRFELQESGYRNDELDVTAKVEIENTGKLAVDHFKISKSGDISIGSIEGRLNKPMVAMEFEAAFGQDRFRGKFKGDVRLIALEGEIDFGSADDYTFAYLSAAVEGKTGIPLGPTGLKLTKIGGRVGYNYYLNFSNGDYSGEPRQNNYLLGLTLGIADVADMFAAEGTSVVQFGDDKLQLNLLGNLQAPRNNPILKSDFNVNYHMPDNTLDGTLRVDVEVPNGTGYIFGTQSPANINFTMAEGEWNVEGALQAKMFREITFTGNTSFTQSDQQIGGSLSGLASYSYYKKFDYNWSIADLKGELQLGFNSFVDANISPSGFEGSLGVHIYGNGKLSVSTSLGTIDGSASITCDANVSYRDNQGLLSGQAAVAVQSTLIDFERSVAIDKTF